MQRPFERALGTDLSEVEIHTDSEAQHSAMLLNAHAYTVGHQIFFAPGQYTPESLAGRRLLAHELVHVIQQRRDSSTRLARQKVDDQRPFEERAQEVLGRAVHEAMVDVVARQDAGTSGEVDFAGLVDTHVQSALNQEANAAAYTADIRANVAPLNSISVPFTGGSLNYAGALSLLMRSLGLPSDLGVPSISYGLDLFIKANSQDIGKYLARPASTDAFNSLYTVAWLTTNLGIIVQNWGDPYGLLELELEGTIDALVSLRERFDNSTDQAERARLGQQIGEASRRALRLNQEMGPLRTALSQNQQLQSATDKSALEQQIQRVNGRITAIRASAQQEQTTLQDPSMGDRVDLLGAQNVQVARPSILPPNDQQTLSGQVLPEQAFPVATDAASMRFLQDLAGQVSDQSRQVAALKDAVVPQNPRFTLDEFAAVYGRWFSFFSVKGRDNDPFYQQMNSLYSGLFSALSLGGWEGGLGRAWIMDAMFTSVSDSLGSAQTDFGSQLNRSVPGRRTDIGGTASQPSYRYGQLYPGTVSGVGTSGELASREEFLRRRMQQTQATAAQLAQLQSQNTPAPSIQLAAVQGGLSTPGAGGPISLIRDPQAQQGWNYLILYGDGDPMLGGLKGQEQKVVDPATARYLLARQQQLTTFQQTHVPTVAGAPIGDPGVRVGGAEAAQVTSAAQYVQGQPATVQNPEAQRLRDQVATAAPPGNRNKPNNMDVAVADLIRDLEAYLDRFFHERTAPEYRIAVVLQIGTKEFGVAQRFMEYFTPAGLAKGIAVLLAIEGTVRIVGLFGDIGKVLSQAMRQVLHKWGMAVGESMIVSLVAWIRRAGQASSFQQGRVWSYFGRDLADEFGQFLQMTLLGGGLGALEGSINVARGAEPRTVGDIMRLLDPYLQDPGNRQIFIDSIKSEIETRRANGAGTTYEDKNLPYLQALRTELEGVSRPGDVTNPDELALPRDRTSRAEQLRAAARKAGVPDNVIDQGIGRTRVSEPTIDAQHTIEVNGLGEVSRCSSACPVVRSAYQRELAQRPDLDQRLAAAERVAENGAETGNETMMRQAARDVAVLEPQIRNTSPDTPISPLVTSDPARYQELVRERGTDAAVVINIPDTWTGSKEADFRGYPRAEEGYRWTIDQYGTLRYDRASVQMPDGTPRPERVWDPVAREFKNVDEGVLRATTDSQPDMPIPANQRAEFDRLMRQRETQQMRRDRLQELAKKRPLTEREQQQLSDSLYGVNEASRQMGERAAEAYVRSQYPKAQKVYPAPGAGSRSGDFDQIWKVPGAAPNGADLYITVEAKGGTGRRTTRQVSGQNVEQGTSAYFDDIASNMANSGEQIGSDLQIARAEGRVRYLQVRAPIGSEGGIPTAKPFQIDDFRF